MSISSRVSGSYGASRPVTYIYDLPYAYRRDLCRVLDENNQWETIGGLHMGYNSTDLNEFGRALFRGASPTEALLQSWGNQNHTIKELFIIFRRVQHFRGMQILADFVDPKYHAYIRVPDENATQELVGLANESQNRVLGNKVTPGVPTTLNQATNPKAGNILINKTPASPIDLGTVPEIPYEQLEEATDGWNTNRILGKGGFGSVYKGKWRATEVAIKRMDQKSAQNGIDSGMKQSLAELKFLNSHRHDNILAVYGYSWKGQYPCIIYQYMNNGSLEDRLLCKQKSTPLCWNSRYKIAKGIACGIHFLHTIGSVPLVHGDIKSANILLSSNLDVKIGDFGLARELVPSSPGAATQTAVQISKVHGTRAYLPDEYLRSKVLTPKVDTYSFGIVLFEIVTGQRAFQDDRRPYKYLKEIADKENIDFYKDVKAGPENSELGAKFVALAKTCTKQRYKERPTMGVVLKAIEEFQQQPTITAPSVFIDTRSRTPNLFPTTTPSSVNRMSPDNRAMSDTRSGSPYRPPSNQQYGGINTFNQIGMTSLTTPRQTDTNSLSTRRSPLCIPSSGHFQSIDNNQSSHPYAYQMNITGSEYPAQFAGVGHVYPVPVNAQYSPPQNPQVMYTLPAPTPRCEPSIPSVPPCAPEMPPPPVYDPVPQTLDCYIPNVLDDIDSDSQGIIPLITALGLNNDESPSVSENGVPSATNNSESDNSKTSIEGAVNPRGVEVSTYHESKATNE